MSLHTTPLIISAKITHINWPRNEALVTGTIYHPAWIPVWKFTVLSLNSKWNRPSLDARNHQEYWATVGPNCISAEGMELQDMQAYIKENNATPTSFSAHRLVQGLRRTKISWDSLQRASSNLHGTSHGPSNRVLSFLQVLGEWKRMDKVQHRMHLAIQPSFGGDFTCKIRAKCHGKWKWLRVR